MSPWSADGKTYTFSKSGATYSASEMQSSFNMSPPTPKQSSQPPTPKQSSSSQRLGMQSDGTYITPSGLVFPKEYAPGIASGRPYRVDQQNGNMTVTWLDENPFTPATWKTGSTLADAMLAGAANSNQSSDPSISFQDQSGNTYATISSPYDQSDVQVQQIYSDKSGNEYATVTSSIAGGTKLAMKQSPQIGSGNVYLANRPIFDPIKGSQLPYGMGIVDQAQQAKYDSGIPSYKSSMDSSMPLFGVLGIGSSSITPNKISNSILDFTMEKNPFKDSKDPIGSFARGSINAFASTPSFLTGTISAGERYTMAGVNRLQGKTGGTTTMTPMEMIAYDMTVMSNDMNQSAKTDPWGTIGALGGSMLIAGGVSKAVGRTSGILRTIGREPIPVERLGYEPKLGYPINPTPTSAKNVLKSFKENTLFPEPTRMSKSSTVPYVPKNAILPNTKLTGTERLMYTGWETDAPVKVGKKWVLPNDGTSEIQGMYGAPVAQTSYTKISSTMSDAVKGMFGSDMSFGIGNKPTMLATTVDKMLPVPKAYRNKLGAKEFIETNSEPGVAYNDLYKSEYQAILGFGQELEITSRSKYITYGGIGDKHFLGRRIPITEQKTTGNRIVDNLNGKSTTKSSKSSSSSYDVYKSEPLFNTAYMGKPVKSSTKQSNYSDINVYKSSITPVKTTYKSSTKSSKTPVYSIYSNSGSGNVTKSTKSPYKSSPNTSYTSTKQSKSTTSISNISTPFKSTKSTIESYTGIYTTPKYTPSKTTPSKTTTSITSTGSPTPSTPSYKTPSYTPPSYRPPKYTPPPYKIPKFKLTEEKTRKTKSKPMDLFGFKEKTKSRTPQSILGGDMFRIPKPSRKKPVLTKNKPRLSKKKIVRRK